jgi:Flp pilus assembly protein TadG
MVEFAIVASLLMSVLLAIVDFGQLFWTNLTMQHAVREGVRYAVTGRSGLAPTPASPTARCDAAVEKIREQAMGLYERTGASAVFKTVAADGSIRTLGAGSCYGAGQIIIVQVNAAARVWTPIVAPFFAGNEYRFSVSTTMKNEAFR